MQGRISGSVILTLVIGMLGTTQLGAGPASAAAPGDECTIAGTAGDDVLHGTSGSDVICGRGGNDVLAGHGAADVLRGGGGRDTLKGAAGADTLAGGDGGDVLTGNDGADVLTGGGGNDDLTGGANADEIDGGDGTNWCIVDAADIATRCVYDLAPASADSLSFSQDSVDVTNAQRSVTVRLHVTDDTGATAVRVTPGEETPWFPIAHAELVSGNIRDGWWEAELVLPRYSQPGTYLAHVDLWDRLNRKNTVAFPETPLEVFDETPDLELPTVTLLSPAPDKTIDVRTKSVSVWVTARITDELSGAADVEVGAWAPRADGALLDGTFGGMHLQSGDKHDGVWGGWVTVFEDSVGGPWSLTISATDRAHEPSGQRVDWYGPGEYVYRAYDPVRNRPFPDNMGTIMVIGRERTDTTAPTVTAAQATPGEVDTLSGPADVDVTVSAEDTGEGVDGVYVELLTAEYDESAPRYLSESLERTAGNSAAGSWTGAIHLPQGTPPGLYYLKVLVWDRDGNMRAYIASGHPDAGWLSPIASNPTVTIVDSSAARRHQP